MLFFRASCTWKVFEAWKKAKQSSLHSRSHQRVWSRSELLAREAFTVWAVKGDQKARRSRNDAQRGTGKVETRWGLAHQQIVSTNATAFFISFIFFRFINHSVFVYVASLPVMVVMFSLDTIVFKLLSIFFPFSLIPTPTYNLIKGQRRGSDEWPGSITFKSTLPKWILADWLSLNLYMFFCNSVIKIKSKIYQSNIQQTHD